MDSRSQQSHESFAKKQFDLAYPLGIENHFWTKARNWIVLNELVKGKSQRIIEVGCGRGVVVEFLRKNGLDCFGVELAQVDIPNGLAAYIETGIAADSLSFIHRNQFDSLLLLDVVEHVAEPKIFLQQLSVNFPSVERIILTLPARTELWSNFDEYYGHYKRYTFESVREICEIAGWEFESIRYTFKWLYLPVLIMSMLGIRRKIEIHRPSAILKPIHSLMAAMSFAEYMCLPKSILGTSIICVLQRKADN